jgi:hypothetical protein
MPSALAPKYRSPEQVPMPERVDAGVRLLRTRRAPAHAFDRVDPDRLDLSTCADCVLGQIFGDYALGLDALDLTEETTVAYGFDLGYLEEQLIDVLTVLWRERIEAMRVGAPAVKAVA